MNVHDWAFVIVLMLVLIGFIVVGWYLNSCHDIKIEQRLEDLENHVLREMVNPHERS